MQVRYLASKYLPANIAIIENTVRQMGDRRKNRLTPTELVQSLVIDTEMVRDFVDDGYRHFVD